MSIRKYIWPTNREAWWYLLSMWICEPWRFRLHGNSINQKSRYIGPRQFWYDGVHWRFGLWWGQFYVEEEP